MARTPKNATIETHFDNVEHTLDYQVPKGTVTTPSLVVTNNSTQSNKISVFINDGESDFLLKKNPLPAGIGKTWRVLEISDQKLNTGYTIKVKADNSSQVNYFLSVSEISDS